MAPKRANIQLCYPFSEARLLNQGRLQSRWTPPYVYHHKLNGERGRAVVSDGRCLLFSSTNELITTLPHINSQLLYLPDGQYDGELYVHGWPLNRIHSAISTITTVHHEAKDIQFHLFDYITKGPLHERLALLNSIYSERAEDLPHIFKLFNYLVNDLDEIMERYEESISLGYEGFVLKDLNSPYIQRPSFAYRSPYWMKFKPKQRDIYPIVKFHEAISEAGYGLQMLGSFTCVDSEGNFFSVGAGKLSHEERRYLWGEGLLPGSRLLIEYQTLSDVAGVPHFSRAVKLILPGEACNEEDVS